VGRVIEHFSLFAVKNVLWCNLTDSQKPVAQLLYSSVQFT